MNINEYIENMTQTQQYLLKYLENGCNDEENYQNFINQINDQNILTNKEDFKVLIKLIISISNYHLKTDNFYNKIEHILLTFKDYIKQYFTDEKICSLFIRNMKLLLFLIQEKIIVVTRDIILKMVWHTNYLRYFAPEIKPFADKEILDICRSRESIEPLHADYAEDIYGDPVEFNIKYDFEKQIMNELPENFEEKRKIGENDNEICELIRKDMIEEFIIYVKKNNYPLTSLIEPSIFETNLFLINDDSVSLIQYSAFFGSIQIFKYLLKNGAEITSDIWYYAIHGDDAEIISILEEKNVNPPNDSYEDCIEECIKCHHNQFANYFITKIDNYEDTDYDICFSCYNFTYFPKDMNNVNSLYYACKYNYFTICKLLISTKEIDINQRVILID